MLLHGWSQCADDWWSNHYAEALLKTHRLIAIDLLGHGESARPHDFAAYSPERCAASVLAVMDAEGLERAGLWGYSLGGLIAGWVALAQPTRVNWLLCGGQGPSPDNMGRKERLLKTAAFTKTHDAVGKTLAYLGADAAFIAESARRNDPLALAAALGGTASDFPDVASSGVRNLFYLGSAERDFRPEERALEAAGRTTLRVLPGANHVQTFTRAAEVLTFALPFVNAS